MYAREISSCLKKSLNHYPILTLLGPRQSGKTTLVRNLFKDFSYHTLEDPDTRQIAQEDPRGFLKKLSHKAILDEIQRVPILTSYLQTIVDDPKNKSQFILTGSNSLLLTDSITQSLAGRTELYELPPLSLSEIVQKNNNPQLNDLLFYGGYPRIHQEKLDPTRWLKSYFQLYVEKDIRQITNISQIDLFEKFVKLTAGRVGQLINASSLANEVGLSSPTISQWITALKSTFICFTLNPHFKNFNKRIVKTAKIYFYDTGLLCYLLGITSSDQLSIHPLRGQIFENFIISESFKKKMNKGQDTNFYFWRDQKGHEIDLIEDRSSYLFPVEIKLSQTFHPQFIKNIQYLNQLQEKDINLCQPKGQVIYGGENERFFKEVQIIPWREYITQSRC